MIDAISPGCSYFDFLDKIGMDGVTLGYEHTLSGHTGDAQSGQKFKDKWGATRVYTGEAISYPVEGPIKNEDDLKSYVPPDLSGQKACEEQYDMVCTLLKVVVMQIKSFFEEG